MCCRCDAAACQRIHAPSERAACQFTTDHACRFASLCVVNALVTPPMLCQAIGYKEFAECVSGAGGLLLCERAHTLPCSARHAVAVCWAGTSTSASDSHAVTALLPRR